MTLDLDRSLCYVMFLSVSSETFAYLRAHKFNVRTRLSYLAEQWNSISDETSAYYNSVEIVYRASTEPNHRERGRKKVSAVNNKTRTNFPNSES
jgi:hypothetical protein